MMNSKKIFCSLVMAALLLGVVCAVGAQPQDPYPLGEITLPVWGGHPWPFTKAEFAIGTPSTSSSGTKRTSTRP